MMGLSIVTMDVRATQIKHPQAPVAVELLKARVASTTDVGRVMGIQERVGAVALMSGEPAAMDVTG
jgi:hypothetical protein